MSRSIINFWLIMRGSSSAFIWATYLMEIFSSLMLSDSCSVSQSILERFAEPGGIGWCIWGSAVKMGEPQKEKGQVL